MADLVSEYQSLLHAEESLAGLDRAMNLARRVSRGGRIAEGQPWLNLERANGHTQGTSGKSAVTRKVSDVADLLGTLPQRADQPDVPEAQYSLLMDILLVVFQQAYFTLVPKAAGGRRVLLRAFDAFADDLPRLADRFHVKALVHLERREVEQAVEAFQGALAATPSDQHDFLTRVQIVWSLLIEHKRVRDAFNCLKEVAPRITRVDYEEFQGLLTTTFEEALKPRPGTRRSRAG